MQIENRKEEMPFAHYRALFAAMDAAEAAKRLNVPFENGEFEITMLGTKYYIAHPEFAIRADTDGIALKKLLAQTLLMRCLLESKSAAPTDEFLTFRELPWGEVYIKPFSGRILSHAAFAFGTRLEAFRAAAEKLGGFPLKHGDASYEFRFLGEYRLQLILWEGDDEFPPNAHLLYTSNFADGFTAEDRVIVGDLLIAAIKSAMK